MPLARCPRRVARPRRARHSQDCSGCGTANRRQRGGERRGGRQSPHSAPRPASVNPPTTRRSFEVSWQAGLYHETTFPVQLPIDYIKHFDILKLISCIILSLTLPIWNGGVE